MENFEQPSIFTLSGIAHLYYSGMNREQALNSLVQAHQNCPHFFPLMDMNEVDHWYNLFDNGYLFPFFPPPAPEVPPMTDTPIPTQVVVPMSNPAPSNAPRPLYAAARMPMAYGLNPYQPATPGHGPEELPQSRIPLLHFFPIYPHIVHELNGHDQRKLQLVSPILKNYIRAQDRVYRKIQLTVQENSLLLYVKSGAMPSEMKIKFHRTDNGCSIQTNGKTTSSKRNPLEECLIELEKYMQKANARIENFVVIQTQEVEIKTLLGRIALIMETLIFKIPIEKFKVYTSDYVGFKAILEQVKPESLTSLKMYNLDHEIEELKLSNVDCLMSQLKNFDTFTVAFLRIDIPLDALAHILSLSVELAPPTAAQISNYKEQLLQCKEMFYHLLRLPNDFNWPRRDNSDSDVEGYMSEKIERIELLDEKAYILIEKTGNIYHICRKTRSE